jgi:hypothetical protein
MIEKFIDAIVLSSTIFGSIYLFNNSLQRIINYNYNYNEHTFPFYLDCFIVGITVQYFLRIRQKQFIC